MEITQIMELIPTQFYIIAVCLYVFGLILKKVNFFKDELIIFVLLVVSLVLSVWKGGFTPDTIMYGIILTGVPVLFNNVFKQMFKLIPEKTEENK